MLKSSPKMKLKRDSLLSKFAQFVSPPRTPDTRYSHRNSSQFKVIQGNSSLGIFLFIPAGKETAKFSPNPPVTNNGPFRNKSVTMVIHSAGMKIRYYPNILKQVARTMALAVTATLIHSARSAEPAAASPSELLERGIYSQETKGDLDAAIALYRQVVREGKNSSGEHTA